MPILRLHTNSQLDLSFQVTNTFSENSISYSVLLQRDQRILLSGELYDTNSAPLPAIIRLTAGGALDGSFQLDYPYTNVFPDLFAEQSDGKFLVCLRAAGPYNYTNPTGTNPVLIRLNRSGSQDTSFTAALGTNSLVWSATLQSDDRLLVCGRLFDANGTPLSSPVRLERDGRLDTTFQTISQPGAYAMQTLVQPDGNILLSGSFGSHGGATRMGIARLFSTEQPTLTISTNRTAPLKFDLRGNVGRTYRVESSGNLTNWAAMTNLLQTNRVMTLTNSASGTTSNRFFRAMLVEP